MFLNIIMFCVGLLMSHLFFFTLDEKLGICLKLKKNLTISSNKLINFVFLVVLWSLVSAFLENLLPLNILFMLVAKGFIFGTLLFLMNSFKLQEVKSSK